QLDRDGPDQDRGHCDHRPARMLEVLPPPHRQGDGVDGDHQPKDGQRSVQPVLDRQPGRLLESRPRCHDGVQEAISSPLPRSCASTASRSASDSAARAAAAAFLVSSLALEAYMSTYSWPERRMISYMI